MSRTSTIYYLSSALLFSLLFFGGTTSVKAQITGPTLGTVNAPLNFSATNPGTTNTWTSDTIDISSSTGTVTSALASFNGTGSSTMVMDQNGNWFLFASTTAATGEIYRLDFGANPDGTPTVNTPVTVAGANHFAIDVVRDDISGNWYGFLIGVTTMWRLDFGTSLTNTPTVSAPMTFADISNPRQITIKKDDVNWYAFIGNYQSSVARLSFGTSLTNTPTSTTATMPTMTGGVGMYFALHKEGSKWYMLATQVTTLNRVVFKSNLGDSAFGTQIVAAGSGLVRAINIGVVADCKNVVAYCMQGQGSSGMTKLNFKGSITNTPTISYMSGISGSTLTSLETAVPYVYNNGVYFMMNYWNAGTSYPVRRMKILSLPAGSTSNQASITNAYATPGTYNINLFTDIASPRGTSGKCQQVTIIPGTLPMPGAFIDSSSNVCMGQNSVTYTIPTVPGATGYTWAYSGTGHTINGAGNSITINFSSSATGGLLSVNAFDGYGGGPARSMSITVNPLPVAAITPAGTASYCQGDMLQLNATPRVKTAYQWIQGSGNVGINNAGYKVTVGGSYMVKLTDSVTGCTATSAATVVTELPVPVAMVTPGSSVAFCQGDSAVLNAAPVGIGNKYLWIGAGTTANDTLATFAAKTPGSYKVIVTGSNHCFDTSSFTNITVNPLPVAAVTPAGVVDICQGSNVLLDAGNAGNVTYKWKKNGTVANGNNTYAATATGDYRVIVTDNNNCTDTSAATTVNVFQNPVISISPVDTSFCDGNAIMINTSSRDTGLVYQWKRMGNIIPNAELPFYQVNTSGIYTVVVSVPNINNCIDSVSANVTVHPLPQPTISWDGNMLTTEDTFFTYEWFVDGSSLGSNGGYEYKPRKNGTYKVQVTDSNGCSNTSTVANLNNVGIHAIVSPHIIKVYPNPATTVLYIQASVAVSATLYDMQGRTVLQNASATIDISGIPVGVYMLRITDDRNVFIKNERILKSE